MVGHETSKRLSAAAHRLCVQQLRNVGWDGETAAALHVPSGNLGEVAAACSLQVEQGG